MTDVMNTEDPHQQQQQLSSQEEKSITIKKYVFKNPDYEMKKTKSTTKISNLPIKQWKSLKQILAQEKNLPWPENAIHYSSIVAPPTFKPSLKYSDISGFECKYKDPHTKLQYLNPDEYKLIQKLPSDIVNAYLSLRGALNPLA